MNALLPKRLAKQAGGFAAPGTPNNLPVGSRFCWGGGLFQPSAEALVPAAIGSQTKRLEKPAIVGVALGQARPKLRGAVGVDIPKGNGCLGEYSLGRVVDQVFNALGQVERHSLFKLSGGAQRDHTNRRIGIIQRPVDEGSSGTVDPAQQPKGAGAVVRFSRGIKRIEIGDGVVAHVSKCLPRKVASVEVRAFQCGDGLIAVFQMQRFVFLAMINRGNAVNAAALAVGLAVPADDRIVPVADE